MGRSPLSPGQTSTHKSGEGGGMVLWGFADHPSLRGRAVGERCEAMCGVIYK